MAPSKGTSGIDRGYIIPIGGAERKRRDPVILEKFVEISGGKNATIVVIPTATKVEENGQRYVDVFTDMGVGKVHCLNITHRRDCNRDDYLSNLEEATGIFITGGNQLRLSTILGGTPIAQLIRRLNADGVHVAGTSAGAAIMPEHMISGGRSGSTPTPRSVSLSPGLGLTNSIVVDQHFRQRDRLGRILAAIAYSPFLTGVGIDENTAIFINPNNSFEVVGRGGVTVVDPSGVQFSNMGESARNEPISITGVKLHILTHGDSYDLKTHTPHIPELKPESTDTLS
ncbi:MAG: cyanophycinase [Candidatus Marinimicrobia bacterium]|nr:cyanophycinase [Candidatus Neomarinimicrobiota bacterium]MBL7009814.1 cyanophycinase [Candidatus Neomarinimicrobiota bacterium]MBL7029947.1 cyanophycinase [Candidatus Neomarinimicrobiota bacterium]